MNPPGADTLTKLIAAAKEAAKDGTNFYILLGAMAKGYEIARREKVKKTQL